MAGWEARASPKQVPKAAISWGCPESLLYTLTTAQLAEHHEEGVRKGTLGGATPAHWDSLSPQASMSQETY